MTIQTALGRRNFLVGTAAAAGGFSLAFSFPYSPAMAAEGRVPPTTISPSSSAVRDNRSATG